MAGKLSLVTTTTVSSDTAQVILTGIDSTNVYMLVVQGLYMDATNSDIRIRFTASGRAVTSSNYRYRHYMLKNDTSSSGTIVDSTGNIDLSQGLGTSMNNAFNMVAYLHNFNDSSQYSYIIYENIHRNTSQGRMGSVHGGGVLQTTATHDGVQMLNIGGANISSGVFSLYKIEE